MADRSSVDFEPTVTTAASQTTTLIDSQLDKGIHYLRYVYGIVGSSKSTGKTLHH